MRILLKTLRVLILILLFNTFTFTSFVIQEDIRNVKKVPDFCIGTFKITFYTACPTENGYWTNTEGHAITATGDKVLAGYTVAAYPKQLPYGSIIYIPGIGVRLVNDCGVGTNQIDVAVATKEEATVLGVQYIDVYIIRWGYENTTSAINKNSSGRDRRELA